MTNIDKRIWGSFNKKEKPAISGGFNNSIKILLTRRLLNRSALLAALLLLLLLLGLLLLLSRFCRIYYIKGKNSKDTQGRNNRHRIPGAFFHNITGLLYTHYLGTEATKRTGKTTAFGLLNQYKETEYHTGKKDNYN